MTFKYLLHDQHFTDVTLVTKGDHQIKDHKVLLSHSSEFFKTILVRNTHPHLLIYLKVINANYLELIIEFIYLGKCEMIQNYIENF